jgi:hypothetical protein
MSRHLVLLTEAHAERSWASARYMRRLVAARRIPFHKIGGRIYFDVADLDAHEDAGRCEPFSGRETGPAANRTRRLALTTTNASSPRTTRRTRAG